MGDGRGRVGLVLVLPGCGRTAVHAVEFRGGVRASPLRRRGDARAGRCRLLPGPMAASPVA
ncbi:hypothetical protein COLSTE_01191 [Collinsella stercoris DSM 13279]|uniref:Uncharacterized protein n=1 Tax=Collinsella stercoris DSM 13279 TaxID=445975 RepID=B6GAU1_9ACTN|nr:hypothetical protein COLSTE_01191 [Collinsella stercoris DSM 13279]